MEHKTYPNRYIRHTLCLPFIYLGIIPIVILDIFLELYHQVCFRLYGLPLIKRSSYIKIDRHRLSYLNVIDKFNCAYCGYANGLMNYAVKIVGKTEEYWCGIKHKKYKDFIEPEHHKNFTEYGDEKGFKEKYKK